MITASQSSVEVRVVQHRLGCIGTGFEEILLRSGELEVIFADVLQTAVGAEITIRFVCLRDCEGEEDVGGFHEMENRQASSH